jgi:hypothetical protein
LGSTKDIPPEEASRIQPPKITLLNKDNVQKHNNDKEKAA